ILRDLCNHNIIELKQKYQIVWSEERGYLDSTPNMYDLVDTDRDILVFCFIKTGKSSDINEKVSEDLKKKHPVMYYTLINMELDWRNAILENYRGLKKDNLNKEEFNVKFISRVNSVFRFLTHRSMKTGEKVDRIYSTLTLLSSESREHLNINGDYFFSIDL